MLIDARTVPDRTRIECDIGVFGGGAAGHTIARQLIGSGRKVCLVESGDLEFEPAAQALYEGDNRYIAGSSVFPTVRRRLADDDDHCPFVASRRLPEGAGDVRWAGMAVGLGGSCGHADDVQPPKGTISPKGAMT